MCIWIVSFLKCLQKREMIFTNVFARETGLQGYAKLRLCDEGIFGRFVCRQHDEHMVEPMSPSCPGLACSFSKVHPDRLAIVDEEGGISVVDTRQTGAKASLTSWLAHENAIFDVDWMPGESQLLTASGDKTVVLWDLPEEKKLATFEGHVCSVKTAKFQTDSKDIFASGSRDGHVIVWDKRSGRKVVDIADAHRTAVGKRRSVRTRGESQSSQLAVTGVLFQKDDTFISVGGTDGVAKVWDLRKISTTKSQPVPKYTLSCKSSGPKIHGLSSLVMDSRCSQLFVSSMGGIIYQFDCINYKPDPVALFSGHEQASFYIKATLSPDDSYLVSGSSDQNAYIWSVADPKAAPVMLKGQTAEVSAVAWCPNDLTRIVTVNDAGSFWIWRINDYSSKDLDDNVALHVVGQAERKVLHQPSGLRTPRKLVPLRNSPSKVLPINPKSLQNLPSNSTSTSKKAISSPSILNYFGKSPSPAVTLKPMFTKSPRKLIISPSKPLQVPGVSEVARAARYSSAKRKLCADDEDLAGSCTAKQPKMSKFSEADTENPAFSYHPPSPGLTKQSLVRVLNPANTNVNPTSSPAPVDKIVKECITDDKQSLVASSCDDKTQLSPRSCLSPTYNLPNAGVNSSLHTPVRQNQTSGEAKPIDWLTQMRIDRQKQNDSSLQSSTAGTPGRTPNKTPSRAPRRTSSRATSNTPKQAASSGIKGATRTPKEKVTSGVKGATRTPSSCKRKVVK